MDISLLCVFCLFPLRGVPLGEELEPEDNVRGPRPRLPWGLFGVRDRGVLVVVTEILLLLVLLLLIRVLLAVWVCALLCGVLLLLGLGLECRQEGDCERDLDEGEEGSGELSLLLNPPLV